MLRYNIGPSLVTVTAISELSVSLSDATDFDLSPSLAGLEIYSLETVPPEVTASFSGAVLTVQALSAFSGTLTITLQLTNGQTVDVPLGFGVITGGGDPVEGGILWSTLETIEWTTDAPMEWAA